MFHDGLGKHSQVVIGTQFFAKLIELVRHRADEGRLNRDEGFHLIAEVLDPLPPLVQILDAACRDGAAEPTMSAAVHAPDTAGDRVEIVGDGLLDRKREVARPRRRQIHHGPQHNGSGHALAPLLMPTSEPGFGFDERDVVKQVGIGRADVSKGLDEDQSVANPGEVPSRVPQDGVFFPVDALPDGVPYETDQAAQTLHLLASAVDPLVERPRSFAPKIANRAPEEVDRHAPHGEGNRLVGSHGRSGPRDRGGCVARRKVGHIGTVASERGWCRQFSSGAPSRVSDSTSSRFTVAANQGATQRSNGQRPSPVAGGSSGVDRRR